MKYLKVISAFFLIAVFLSPFLIVPRVLKINKIDCISQYGPCSQTQENNLGQAEGRGLSEAKRKVGEVASKDPKVTSYSIQYKFPDILKVTIILRKPNFALKGSDTKVSLVDKEGVVLGWTERSELPLVVTNHTTVGLGEKIDNKDIFASRILSGMFFLFGTKLGTIKDSYLEIEVPNGPKVIFPLEGDERVLLGAANLILSRLNKGGEEPRIENVKEIDLRFKNPILK